MKTSNFTIGAKIVVNDNLQKNYSYTLEEKFGKEASDFKDSGFNFELTPQEMLNNGIFEGKYLNDCNNEFPEEWFQTSIKKRSNKSNPKLNYFGIKSRMSLNEWKKRNWIIGDDPRGWFQWFCRYYIGRRTQYDKKQISRWKSFKRHMGQLRKNCEGKDKNCRVKQKQALLQWSYNSIKI